MIKQPSKSKVKNKSVLPSEFGSITICALRYSQTIVDCIEEVGFAIVATTQNWTYLSKPDQVVIKRDTKGVIEGRLGPVPTLGYLDLWQNFDLWTNQPVQENEQQTKTEVVGLGFLTIYALRYCVGQTYMVSTIVDATKENWELLQFHDRQQIQDDVQTAIATRYLGMAFDRQTWLNFNEWIAEKMK
jgi:hypothetical protein